MQAVRRAPGAARTGALRVGVVLTSAAALLYCVSVLGWSNQSVDARRSTLAAGDGQAAADSTQAALFKLAPRAKYGLPEEDVTSAVLGASERYGEMVKAGLLPSIYWSEEKREWRERKFMNLARRDMAQPHLPEYWGADTSGDLFFKPLQLPYPSCHTYINHMYKIIFIIHPKSASTATKRYMNLCHIHLSDSCLSPLESAADRDKLRRHWKEYFVFTFVRNPWVRAYSSWKFLRQEFMLGPGEVARGGAAACVQAGWTDFCGDPLLLGRMCMALPHCCPGKEGAYFMHYHITDQATCMLTEEGQLAVDFIGRVEHVDEDMQKAIKLINARLPRGVAPLKLPASVAAINVGPQSGKQPPDNSQYLPAFQGANATCFARLSRFYEKDVELLFPSVYLKASQAAA